MKTTDWEKRFLPKVRKTKTCWLWIGTTVQGGYGQIMWGGRTVGAHRVSYEKHFGPIGKGLEIDHLCRVRNCVKPSHLEAVTRAVNLRRGMGFAGINARKTHCPSGHAYKGDNLFFLRTSRMCRSCLIRRNVEGKLERHRRKLITTKGKENGN